MTENNKDKEIELEERVLQEIIHAERFLKERLYDKNKSLQAQVEELKNDLAACETNLGNDHICLSMWKERAGKFEAQVDMLKEALERALSEMANILPMTQPVFRKETALANINRDLCFAIDNAKQALQENE